MSLELDEKNNLANHTTGKLSQGSGHCHIPQKPILPSAGTPLSAVCMAPFGNIATLLFRTSQTVVSIKFCAHLASALHAVPMYICAMKTLHAALRGNLLHVAVKENKDTVIVALCNTSCWGPHRSCSQTVTHNKTHSSQLNYCSGCRSHHIDVNQPQA